MNPFRTILLLVVCLRLFQPSLKGAGWMDAYFAAEVKRLESNWLKDIRSAEDWNSRKAKYRQELFEMLGMSPLPEKSDLKPVVTGKAEREDIVVERLHFQSMPGLYVTANFYLPKKFSGKLPTILYVCGHGHYSTNGVSYGNKVVLQHHAAWFARNGYACLIIDTVQLGEIPGIHHGTYREKMWWWNSKGYSSAAVEAWNCIRALDYLSTRPEVDSERFGVTGRSGGGAYSWWIAALDDRIKVAAPVAGITDLHNYVVDGAVEGHCDCMFFVNTREWDYPMVAALVAPRPLLIVNTDKDSIFPLDGVLRTHAKAAEVYRMLNATNNLGLVITEGGHSDTQDLQVPVFRWFNRFLKNETGPVEMVAKPVFRPEELKVFDQLPTESVNKRIGETFTRKTAVTQPDQLKKVLAEKVFHGWPDKTVPLNYSGTVVESESGKNGHTLSVGSFTSQDNVILPVFVLRARESKEVRLMILDEASWPSVEHMIASEFKYGQSSGNVELPDWIQKALGSDRSIVFLAPRGIGPTAMPKNERTQTQIRRRFMLLGQTIDSMRVWDIRRGMALLNELPLAGSGNVVAEAQGAMAVNVLYATMFEEKPGKLVLHDLPESQIDGPDYLNVLRFTDLPEIKKIVSSKTTLIVD